MWRFAGRTDLRQMMHAARRVAEDIVLPVVAARGTIQDGSKHEWTADKARVLQALDDSGLTSIVNRSSVGVTMQLAVALWELAWIDSGSAVCSLSGSLAQMVIRDAGMKEQQFRYVGNAVLRHGALCLTEPVPGAGAEAATLEGRVRVVDWNAEGEPVLEVEKRGRFISHMDFADFVVAAVDSGDERIHGSCLVILEPTDAGVFDRGVPVRKLGHQLSSTTNPIFRLQIPADRIVGGYTIEDGAIVPKLNHREALGAAFRRARAVMALVTSAKVLSAVAALIRSRSRSEPNGAWPARLLDMWAAGEAAASLGFSAAQLCDEGGLQRHAEVICPAAKLFSTVTTCAMLPHLAAEGVGLRDKLADAQVEAMYLGPEAIQRRQISAFMVDEAFRAQFGSWSRDMREAKTIAPCAGTVAAAMELWSWTLDRLREASLFREARQSVTFPMADALCELLAARALTVDVLALGRPAFYIDLAMIQSVRAAGLVAQICCGLLLGHDVAEGTMVDLRARVFATFSGVAPARERAIEFIRRRGEKSGVIC
jgi:hypothetical protein